MDTSDPWRTFETNGPAMTFSLRLRLLRFPRVSFDHIIVGHADEIACVFVVKGEQETVLYDKTKGFPSDTLLASLVLLGN